jgi:pyridoxal phosphate enzyme (YggS family)
MPDTLTRYHELSKHIELTREKLPLAPKQVQLIAVAKTHPAEAVRPLLQAGHRVFGENKVQEAAEKWLALRVQYPDIELHLIGSLQSNKAKEALETFDVIETVDRPSLVDALVKARGQASGVRCHEFYIQVNIGEEKQKGGVMPQDLPDLLKYISASSIMPNALNITGLMCVPPHDENPAPYFALLHKMAKEHGLANLSMGMSGDYEAAIRFGATHVRIGTALFGERG